MLDKNLDDSSLTIDGFTRIDENKNEIPANFEYRYDKATRQIIVFINNNGEILSKNGGSFNIHTKIREDVPKGTVVINNAIVYFPTVMEATKTNTVVSIVPYDTSMVYNGLEKFQYSDNMNLSVILNKNEDIGVNNQKIEYKIGESSYTEISERTGETNLSIPDEILPGKYNIEINYNGDGYYYKGSKMTKEIEIEKENVIISTPNISIIYPIEDKTIISMTDDEEGDIKHQEDEPKTIMLEYSDGGDYKKLGEGTLVNGIVNISYKLDETNKPTKLNCNLRARFAGDKRYNTGESIGILEVIDNQPPMIEITNPKEEKYIGNVNNININFDVTDNLDTNPTKKSYLINQENGNMITVSNGQIIIPLTIESGYWMLVVESTDFAGNVGYNQSGVFEVIHDTQPPRTEISVSSPQYKISEVFLSPYPPDKGEQKGVTFITSQTSITLTAVDDLINIGDGIGLGVKESLYEIYNSTPFVPLIRGIEWNIYFGTFTIMGADGKYFVHYYSVDNIGNTELEKETTYYLDNTAPESQLTFDGIKYIENNQIYVTPETIIGIKGNDPIINDVASGINWSEYQVDSETTTWRLYTTTMTFTEGIHSIRYRSFDNLLNVEQTKETILFVDDTSPNTRIEIGEPKLIAFGNDIISKNTEVGLISEDIINLGVKSGVSETKYRVIDKNNTENNNLQMITSDWSIYNGTFTIAGEGDRIIEYYSIDKVLNKEEVKEKKVILTTIPEYTVAGIEKININEDSEIIGNMISNSLVDIKGNSKVTGDVYGYRTEITGNPIIKGNIYCIENEIKGNPVLTGEIKNEYIKISSEPINISVITEYVKNNNDNVKIPLGNSKKNPVTITKEGDIKFELKDKDSIELSTGTYYFNEIKLAGESKIFIIGEVRIICQGGIIIEGNSKINYDLVNINNIANQTNTEEYEAGKTKNLFILINEKNKNTKQNNTVTNIKISGGSNLSGIIYAPYSEINIGDKSKINGNIYVNLATIDGESLVMDNTKIGKEKVLAPVMAQLVKLYNDTLAEFKQGEIFAYPNPAKNNKNPIFHIEVGVADKVEIKVYNIVAEQVYETILTNNPTIINGKYAYEHEWNIKEIASGVYIYNIEAKKENKTPIKVTKKCAVIR